MQNLRLPKSVTNERVLRLDWSRYTGILKCSRYGWHSIVHRRVLAARDEAQGFGHVIHEVLDMRQREGKSGPYSTELLSRMEALIDKRFEGVILDEDEHRTSGRAKEVLQLYQSEYPEEPFDILASEIPKEKPLGTVQVPGAGEVSIIWQGRTDGIWRDRVNGKHVVKDTKTMKEGDPKQEHLKYKLGGQLPMYCWLFSEPNQQINTAVIDMVIVRRPLVRMTVKSLPRNEFHRLVLEYSDACIALHRSHVLRTVESWLCQCNDLNPPPMNVIACVRKGERPCPYISVCGNETEEERMRWLYSGEFQNDDWNPMTPVCDVSFP